MAARGFGRHGLILVRTVLIISLAIGGLLFVPAVSHAEESAVAASFTPSELTMLPGEKRTAVLLVENPADTAVTIDSVVVSQDDRVTVKVEGPGTAAISAGGSVAMPARVELSAVLPSKVTITATVRYTAVPKAEPTPNPNVSSQAEEPPKPSSPPLVGVALASLVVESGTTPSAAASPLTIESSGDSALADTQSVDVYFTVQNTIASDLDIRATTVTYPSFLQVEVPGTEQVSGGEAGFLEIDLGESLPAGDGAVVHLHVTAPRGIQPGDVLLVLAVTYAYGQDSTGLATGSHSLALTVFGEAAVLGVFGAALAPALFVVPGVLFVLVFWFMWMRVHPRETPVDMKSPSLITSAVALGILGVLFALPLIPLYRAVRGRDPRAVYGFNDIGWMCLLGIAAGFVAWLIATMAWGLVWRYRFREGDSASTVLRKLTSRGRLLPHRRPDLSQVPSAKVGDKVVFILRENGGTTLVCPAIIAAPREDSATFETTLTGLRSKKQNRKLYKHARDNAVLSFQTPGGAVESKPLTDMSEFGRQAIITADSSR